MVEVNAIIDGVGNSKDSGGIDAAFAAMRLYYSAAGPLLRDLVEWRSRGCQEPKEVGYGHLNLILRRWPIGTSG
jgi:hypothetical protein